MGVMGVDLTLPYTRQAPTSGIRLRQGRRHSLGPLQRRFRAITDAGS